MSSELTKPSIAEVAQTFKDLVEAGLSAEHASAVARLPMCEARRDIFRTLESLAVFGTCVTFASKHISEDVTAAWHKGTFKDTHCEVLWGLFEVAEYTFEKSKWSVVKYFEERQRHWSELDMLVHNSEDIARLSLSEADEISSRLSAHNELLDLFAPEGLEVRGDSKMCRDYILHDEGDKDEILEMMLEMRFFFDHTTYQNMRRYGTSETAKLAALHKYDGDVKSVPPSFEDTTYLETLIAWREIRAEEAFEAEKANGHECLRCKAWKDVTDEDYCSMCGSSSDDSDYTF